MLSSLEQGAFGGQTARAPFSLQKCSSCRDIGFRKGSHFERVSSIEHCVRLFASALAKQPVSELVKNGKLKAEYRLVTLALKSALPSAHF
jgi:hypothetical protein